MTFDAHKNLAISNVATAPSPASSGTSLVVTAGHGPRFPAVPFNATIWPAGTQPDPTNAEIVRVTNISTDTLTITRTQESTSARSVIVGDQIAATVTAKTLTDIETLLNAKSRAYLPTSDQSINSASWTKVNLSAESYDPGSNFDAATNYRFVAPVAGYYLITGGVALQTPIDQQWIGVAIYKNNAAIAYNLIAASGTKTQGVKITDVVYLAATDYIELFVYQDGTGARSINNGETQSWMAIHFISQ